MLIIHESNWAAHASSGENDTELNWFIRIALYQAQQCPGREQRLGTDVAPTTTSPNDYFRFPETDFWFTHLQIDFCALRMQLLSIETDRVARYSPPICLDPPTEYPWPYQLYFYWRFRNINDLYTAERYQCSWPRGNFGFSGT